MASKPILFSTPMVQAILDGRKTQTRRVIRETYKLDKEWGLDREPYYKDGKWYYDKQISVDGNKRYEMKPYYHPGDILWVRETWRDRWGMAYANYGSGNAYPIDDVREIEYKAGGNGFFMRGCNLCPDEPTIKWGEWSKWRSSIHMPREAARIFLRVTNVRVERLQNISFDDAIAEGMGREGHIAMGISCPESEEEFNFKRYPERLFRRVWDSTIKKQDHTKYGWNANPWVWVIEFERVSEDGRSKDK